MSTSDEMKAIAYEQLARIGKAMSSPNRLRLLDILRNGPRSVESLAEEAQMGVANVSRHLQVLRGAGQVECEKKGLHVTYRVAGPCVCEFFQAMCRIAEARLAEFEKIISQFTADAVSLEAVDRTALMERAHKKEITMIDVRPAAEYGPDTFRVRFPFRWTNWNPDWNSFPASKRSWHTAAGPTVSWRPLPWRRSDGKDLRPGACGREFLNGGHTVCPWQPQRHREKSVTETNYDFKRQGAKMATDTSNIRKKGPSNAIQAKSMYQHIRNTTQLFGIILSALLLGLGVYYFNILFVIGALAAALFAGRVFCGWICPNGAWLDHVIRRISPTVQCPVSDQPACSATGLPGVFLAVFIYCGYL
jgi:DNA-binding transcriptional ArsR family regulator